MIAEAESRHALVVATARYSDPKLQQLRAPAADAERLVEVLRDPAKGNFDVEVLLDASYATLTRRIATFFRDRRPNDLLLLHFSCHGVKDDRGELYLAATDTELDLLSATGVSTVWLNDQISRTRSRRTVVLLDCCFSGSFPFGLHARAGGAVNAPEQFEGRGRAIITASSAMEYAYEGDHLTGKGQPSVFTEAVVEGLDTGKADLDHDQLISVDDLYGYVYDRVRETTPSQTPNKKSEIEGPLYLARSTYRPEIRPATLDPELLARTEDRYAGIRTGAVQELAALLASRDPATVLAARQTLSQMTDDDSRQVSSSAQEALARDERLAREGMIEERPARASVETEDVGADDRADRGGVSAGPRPSPGPPGTSKRLGPSRWARAHPRLAGALLILVPVAAVIASQILGGGGGGGSNAPSADAEFQALLRQLPASMRARCINDPAEQGLVKDEHPPARAQAHCDSQNQSYFLSYGLWASPSKANAFVQRITVSDFATSAIPCSTSTTSSMREILSNATLRCGDIVEASPNTPKGIAIYWNENGSPLGGVFQWNDRDQAAAVRQWKAIVKAT
jgi:hypothetical protein